MSYLVGAIPGSLNLQASLAMGSAMTGPYAKHHPITCTSKLAFHDDGRFECEHGEVPPGDRRTQSCLDHSIAILLIELLREKEDT